MIIWWFETVCRSKPVASHLCVRNRLKQAFLLTVTQLSSNWAQFQLVNDQKEHYCVDNHHRKIKGSCTTNHNSPLRKVMRQNQLHLTIFLAKLMSGFLIVLGACRKKSSSFTLILNYVIDKHDYSSSVILTCTGGRRSRPHPVVHAVALPWPAQLVAGVTSGGDFWRVCVCVSTEYAVVEGSRIGAHHD